MRYVSPSRLDEQAVWWRAAARWARVLPALLLLALGAGPAAHAVTAISIDGHPAPVTLTVGETVTIRADVVKAGNQISFRFARDVSRSGQFDLNLPITANVPISDGGGLDADATDTKIAWVHEMTPDWPAGPYLLRAEEFPGGNAVVLPVTLVPKPQPQAISGRVAVVSEANPSGTPPPSAILWAASDPNTLVASADVRPDGSYTLPVSPGTYILFAEWFGHLRSPRQVVSLVAGQQIANVDLPLVRGEEVSGRVAESGSPVADAVVHATAANGTTFTTRTLRDGSYTLVLPTGAYAVTALGLTEPLTVADQPLDGVDFPPPPAATDLAKGTIVTVAGNGIQGPGGRRSARHGSAPGGAPVGPPGRRLRGG